MRRRDIKFGSTGVTLAGELVLPEHIEPYPALLLIGGTMSDTRDGDPAGSLKGKAPAHGMLRVIADHLARVGIATLRWDKRGVGASSGGERRRYSDVWTDVDDAEYALYTLRDQPEIDAARLAVLGESAGGYFACFLARRTNLPAAYVLQAALYSSIPAMIAFNYQRVADFCNRGPDEADWVKQAVPQTYRFSQHWSKILAAAQRGDDEYRSTVDSKPYQVPLARLKQELSHPPADQFRYIKKPVLVIQGDKDMNVPPRDCYDVAQTLREAGNQAVTRIVVPGADHSMQLAPTDDETRLRERISMDSFRRPYSEFFLQSLSEWLNRQYDR